MPYPLQHISDLAEILFAHGVSDVVVSPGSRNAPLIRAFYERFGESCISLVDERSAAYFALGQSLETKKPTVLICTSGTAALNYAPAVSEAFYQHVPLLVITADRPPEWIGQQDNQAIQQNNIFEKNIKATYLLPVEITNHDELWYVHRMVNEAICKTVSANHGPVHINVPLRELLYEKLPEASENVRIILKEEPEIRVPENSKFAKAWQAANSVMVIAGQLPPDEEMLKAIQRLSADTRVVVIAEPVSNLHEVAVIANPEVVFNSKTDYPVKAIPELVVYFGGQMVSKKIKLFLRGLTNTGFMFISSEDHITDTFQNIDIHIHADPKAVLNQLEVQSSGRKSVFKDFWENENLKAARLTEKYINNISFSDLQVFKKLSENLPDDAIVFAGNSSVVRYLMYFNQKNRMFYSNRGVSGIDGCLSTAAGLASKTSKRVYAIVGDLAFGYDSNALWNRNFPKNLKIILINNEGGGIFHLLKGPSEHEAFRPLVNAFHPIDFQKLTESFGLSYQLNISGNELVHSLIDFVSPDNGVQVLEIRTPGNGEPQITKDFFKFLNKNYGTELDSD